MTAAATAGAVAIRRATVADLGPVSRLWFALTCEHAAHDPQFRPRPGAKHEVDRLVHELLRDRRSLVLLADDEDATAIALCIARIDHAPPILAETRRLEISDLYVTVSSRRRGVGRELVRRALEWASEHGISRVEVRVASRNAGGQAFWRSLGFGAFVDVLQRHL